MKKITQASAIAAIPIALLLCAVLVIPLYVRPEHSTGDVIGITVTICAVGVFYFPLGLCAIFLPLSSLELAYKPYGVQLAGVIWLMYAALAVFSIIKHRAWLLAILVLALVANVGGCFSDHLRGERELQELRSRTSRVDGTR